MPPVNGIGGDAVGIDPIPLPFAYGVNEVRMTDGTKLVTLVIETPCGRQIVFADQETARDMGRKLIQASGLYLPS